MGDRHGSKQQHCRRDLLLDSQAVVPGQLLPPPGEVAPNGQSVGVFRAQYPQVILHQLVEGRRSASRIPRTPPPTGKAVPRGQGAEVVEPKVQAGEVG